MQSARVEVIPGDRIYLTTLLQSDVEIMTRWFADLETTAYIGQLGRAYRREDEQRWYDSLAQESDNVTFGIVVRETQQLIGSVSLMHIDQQHGRAELGIGIGDKTAWGRGYGSEAVRLMSEYGCFFKGLYTICLSFVEFNERGRRAYARVGFREAGRWRGAYIVGGARYDSVWMDITRDELDLSRMRLLLGQLGEHGHAEG